MRRDCRYGGVMTVAEQAGKAVMVIDCENMTGELVTVINVISHKFFSSVSKLQILSKLSRAGVFSGQF